MTKTNIIILGIDPGFADTGYGLIKKNGNHLSFISAGSIKTPSRQNFADRLNTIYKNINKLIEEYQPDLVGVEKLYFAKNVKTALDVGQARGVIMLALAQNKVPFLELTPLQVKQSISASGAASKRQVGLMVKTILCLKSVPEPDDAADALAVAIGASFINPRLIA